MFSQRVFEQPIFTGKEIANEKNILSNTEFKYSLISLGDILRIDKNNPNWKIQQSNVIYISEN